MKNKKYLIAGIVLLVLSGVIILFFIRKNKREEMAWVNLQQKETHRLERDSILSREIALRSIAQTEERLARKQSVQNTQSLDILHPGSYSAKGFDDQKSDKSYSENDNVSQTEFAIKKEDANQTKSLNPASDKNLALTTTEPTQANIEEIDHQITRTHYDGFVGKLAAKFTIDWHVHGIVSGEYWHPTRNPAVKYKLTGTNSTDGVLRLNEYKKDEQTSTIILKKNLVDGRIEWTGTMHNTDGRKLDVLMKR